MNAGPSSTSRLYFKLFLEQQEFEQRGCKLRRSTYKLIPPITTVGPSYLRFRISRFNQRQIKKKPHTHTQQKKTQYFRIARCRFPAPQFPAANPKSIFAFPTAHSAPGNRWQIEFSFHSSWNLRMRTNSRPGQSDWRIFQQVRSWPGHLASVESQAHCLCQLERNGISPFSRL